MRKIALSMLAVVLLMVMVCGSAFALVGDLTTSAVKAYADPEMTDYIGTIPKYSSVLVRAYGAYADVFYNNIECFIKPSALTNGKYDYNYIGTATLKKNSIVYQRPSTTSNCIRTNKNRKVLVYAVSDGYALVRTRLGGIYGFVTAESLRNLKPY